MPESYAEAWRRLDDDFDRRTREATALQIEGTLRAHHWEGGYGCRCGRPISMPRDWGQHLLELALYDEIER
jgi:hypothetical protein